MTCRPLFSLLGRLAQSLLPEPADFQNPSQLCPSPANSESTLLSVPSGSPDTFASLHSSLAPRDNSQIPSGSPRGSTENLSSVGPEGSSPTMADQKRRVLLPPSYGIQTKGNLAPIREIQNPAYEEPEEQPGKKSVPLPDYETLFPQRRHGVQGQTKWDHIIAEVNQKHRDSSPILMGPEVSVDDPVEHKVSPRSSVSQESPVMRNFQTKPQETKPVSTKKALAPTPPKQAASPLSHAAADFSQKKGLSVSQQSPLTPSQPAAPASVRTDTSSSRTSGDGAKKALQPAPAPAPRAPSPMNTTPAGDQRKEQGTVNKEAPTAKPRQRSSPNEPTKEQQSAVNSNIPAVSNSSMSIMDKKIKNFAEMDPFPSIDLLSRDPWAQQKQNKEDSLFTLSAQKKPQDQRMTENVFDQIFSQEQSDPFASFNGSDSNKQNEFMKMDDESKLDSPAFQRKNSQRGRKSPPSTTPSQQTPPTANRSFRDVPLQHHTDVKTQSSFIEGEDLFGAKDFFETLQPLQVVPEEPESLSGGKESLRSRFSPSDVQPVSTQNSNGSGLAIYTRR